MMSKVWWLPLASVCALLSLAAVACGGESVTISGSRCSMSDCDEGLVCDEADGVCKCGGSICKEGERCSLDDAPTCVATSCDFVQCERGETCNPDTGACQCGSERCAEGQWCVDSTCLATDLCEFMTCSPGMSCDPRSGLCACGGVVCDEGESCVDGICTSERCGGVSCGANSVCSPEDGRCRCGDLDGPICSTGEACLEDGAAFACAISTKCEQSACRVGTICDPEDGLCRCGGVGTGFEVCDQNESCIDGTCRGGLLCEPDGIPTVCAPGLSCDPADGVCKCGGEGGVECGSEEACTLLAGEPSCLRVCTLLAGGSACAFGESCYFDQGQAHAEAFCAPTGDRGLNGLCEEPNECAQNLHCSLGGICLQLCKVEDGTAACAGAGPSLQCVPFGSDGEFGSCRAP